MKTEETNKLIAEFMGFKLQDNPNERFYNKWIINSNAYGGRYSFEEFYFDVDWNWLMEVVEKIESLDGHLHICDNDIFVHFPKRVRGCIRIDGEKLKLTKIKAVYKACVTFIEWYNEQNSAEEKLK